MQGDIEVVTNTLAVVTAVADPRPETLRLLLALNDCGAVGLVETNGLRVLVEETLAHAEPDAVAQPVGDCDGDTDTDTSDDNVTIALAVVTAVDDPHPVALREPLALEVCGAEGLGDGVLRLEAVSETLAHAEPDAVAQPVGDCDCDDDTDWLCDPVAETLAHEEPDTVALPLGDFDDDDVEHKETMTVAERIDGDGDTVAHDDGVEETLALEVGSNETLELCDRLIEDDAEAVTEALVLAVLGAL